MFFSKATKNKCRIIDKKSIKALLLAKNFKKNIVIGEKLIQ